MKKHEIVVKKEDVIPYIYFVCSMAQRGKMYGGLNGKSDYIGGIFDRWINIIPESVIFNKYLLPKISNNISVISDYYEYNPKKAGIAPDVLGVSIGNEVKPFAVFDEGWTAVKNAPQIEVKSFKASQYMVSLRNQGYDEKYLVMVETNLDVDYLLPFFEKEAISEGVYIKLKMNDDAFIKSNTNDYLSPVTKITRDNSDLGSLRLITVCIAKDFMRYSNLCHAGESPVYIKYIKETRTPKRKSLDKPLLDYLAKNKLGLYHWNTNVLNGNNNDKMLDVYIDNIRNLFCLKTTNSSIAVFARKDAKINDTLLEANKTYIIKFQRLNRSPKSGEEYFINKSIVDIIPNKEKEMLKDIENYIR